MNKGTTKAFHWEGSIGYFHEKKMTIASCTYQLLPALSFAFPNGRSKMHFFFFWLPEWSIWKVKIIFPKKYSSNLGSAESNSINKVVADWARHVLMRTQWMILFVLNNGLIIMCLLTSIKVSFMYYHY